LEWIAVPLSGIAAALLGAALLIAWSYRSRQHERALQAMSPRVLVTGTRGKSSTVRLLHAVFAEAGLRPWGRVTGTVTEEFTPDRNVVSIHRKGQHSVVELLDTVKRASRKHARSLVCECMAVRPELIELTQTMFLKAEIVVITNVRTDHLEDEGLDIFEIARSLCAVAEGAPIVFSSETDTALREVLAQGVHERGGRIVFASGIDLPQSILQEFQTEHPDNVALAFAIADHLKIDREMVRSALRNTTHESFAIRPTTHGVSFRSKELVFSNLGSVNDPQSTRVALEEVKAQTPVGGARVAIIMSRWDRPLRSLQFAGFVDPHEFDAVVIAGPAYHPICRVLRKNSWESKTIRPLRWIDSRSNQALMTRITGVAENATSLHFIFLANTDPPIARRILRMLKPLEVTFEGSQ